MTRLATPVIRASTPKDHSAVLGLLVDAGLPTDGITAALDGFVVAEGAGGAIVGGAALESYGAQGLVRSVVVAPSARGTGLGRALTEFVIAGAGAQGIKDLYLLTTTAEHFFPRFGFRPITREAVPKPVHASVEFQGACPASAVVMHRPITGS